MQSLEIQMFLHTQFPCVITRCICDGVGRLKTTFLINPLNTKRRPFYLKDPDRTAL